MSEIVSTSSGFLWGSALDSLIWRAMAVETTIIVLGYLYLLAVAPAPAHLPRGPFI